MVAMGAYWLLLLPLLLQATADTQQKSLLLPRAEWIAALRAVVESERAFARSAAEKGTKEAFLAFLGEDSILFRPQPVPGKQWMLDRPAAPGRLSWRPIFADVSAAGDLGYTTGPYEFRKQAADDVPASYGNYFTIWKKQPNGLWKVLIDFGTANPPPAKIIQDFNPMRAKPPTGLKSTKRATETLNNLSEWDRKLSDISASRGAAALLPYIAQEARFLRADRQPTIGVKELRTLLPAEPGIWIWMPVAFGASTSGDLGYTYGTFEVRNKGALDRAAQFGYYVRVWKRQPSEGWKIVFEVATF